MTAALRVGATLGPTPLEQARQALVDAARYFYANNNVVSKASRQLDAAYRAYCDAMEPAP